MQRRRRQPRLIAPAAASPGAEGRGCPDEARSCMRRSFQFTGGERDAFTRAHKRLSASAILFRAQATRRAAGRRGYVSCQCLRERLV